MCMRKYVDDVQKYASAVIMSQGQTNKNFHRSVLKSILYAKHWTSCVLSGRICINTILGKAKKKNMLVSGNVSKFF